jgi:hypothetical protein
MSRIWQEPEGIEIPHADRLLTYMPSVSHSAFDPSFARSWSPVGGDGKSPREKYIQYIVTFIWFGHQSQILKSSRRSLINRIFYSKRSTHFIRRVMIQSVEKASSPSPVIGLALCSKSRLTFIHYEKAVRIRCASELRTSHLQAAPAKRKP